MYHQVAEGLPDRFVFDKVGANQAAIDIHPLKTPRTRSQPEVTGAEPEDADNGMPPLVDADSESDIDDAEETQDRIIASVAMSAAAVSAAAPWPSWDQVLTQVL